jgi:hypothetical protein
MNIKRIIKEEIDEFGWAKGDIDLRDYILNFKPSIKEQDFNVLIKRLNDLGITEFGDGVSLEHGFLHNSSSFLYESNGIHFIYVKNNNRIMASSGPLYGIRRLDDYMEDAEGWNPFNLLDGREVLNM